MADTETVQNEAVPAENAAAPQGGTAVQQMELESVAPTTATGQENLDLLLDIQMPITVTLGKAQLPLKKLLQLAPGTVLNLDKSVGQPAELFVQDIPFATADVVVVDGCFAVRIRELLGTEETKLAGTPK